MRSIYGNSGRGQRGPVRKTFNALERMLRLGEKSKDRGKRWLHDWYRYLLSWGVDGKKESG